MSETVYYKGLLRLAGKLKGETLEEQCRRVLIEKEKHAKEEELGDWYDSYQEKLEDKLYDDYIVLDESLYTIANVETIDPYNDIFSMQEQRDGLNFKVQYYNGGCSFSEAIEEAYRNLITRPTTDVNTYAIYIELEGEEREEYHYQAQSIKEALGMFFVDNPCLSYDDIIKHVKI